MWAVLHLQRDHGVPTEQGCFDMPHVWKLHRIRRLSQQQQLETLSKYSSRIANIDMPYMLRVGVNPKGPSQTANLKDKSDRATSEQVLDPRTRIILFKMIGRGLITEVNGCVSTGKEVSEDLFTQPFDAKYMNCNHLGKCVPCPFSIS